MPSIRRRASHAGSWYDSRGSHARPELGCLHDLRKIPFSLLPHCRGPAATAPRAVARRCPTRSCTADEGRHSAVRTVLDQLLQPGHPHAWAELAGMQPCWACFLWARHGSLLQAPFHCQHVGTLDWELLNPAAKTPSTVEPAAGCSDTIFILGPSHHKYTPRCELSTASTYDTPLGMPMSPSAAAVFLYHTQPLLLRLQCR